MVRVPLTPEQIEAGRRLGALFRETRAGRDPATVAHSAGISPETLRKIEMGRLPSPGFGTVVGLCAALGLPLDTAAGVWLGADPAPRTPPEARGTAGAAGTAGAGLR